MTPLPPPPPPLPAPSIDYFEVRDNTTKEQRMSRIMRRAFGSTISLALRRSSMHRANMWNLSPSTLRNGSGRSSSSWGRSLQQVRAGHGWAVPEEEDHGDDQNRFLNDKEGVSFRQLGARNGSEAWSPPLLPRLGRSFGSGVGILKGATQLGQTRAMHATAPRENGLIIAGVAVVGFACALKIGTDSYEAYAKRKEEEVAEAGGSSDGASGFMGGAFDRRFYQGGFQTEMDKDEAAKILGVRKRSSVKKIKEKHRKLLMLNHPDAGGSTLLAGKINEAKELLIAGKNDDE